LEVGIDITERKRAEEKLREASLYSRSLIEASLDPLVTISADGKITDANKSTEEATGFSRDQLIGRDFSDYFTDPEGARKSYRRVFTEGFVIDYPLAIRHKSGKITDVLYNATVYRNEAGEIQGIFAAARDITERKKTQEALRKAHDELEMRVEERTKEITRATAALRESEGDLNRAQAVAKTGSWRLDLRCNVLLWSDETYRIFGIPKRTPMTYEGFLGTIHPDDREYVDQKWKAALQGGPYDTEHRTIVNGEVKWVREKAELEFDKDGSLIGGFGTAQDITQRKELEAKLAQYAKHLEELVEERTRELKDAERLATIGEVAGMVGHDIRNPLYAIEGALYLAREELRTIPPTAEGLKTAQEMLETIREQTGYVNKIVVDLQDYARPLKPQLEETDLQQLLQDALSSLAIPKEIECLITIEDNCRHLSVDRTMMKRAVANLLANAVQAMPNGGKITVNASKKEGKTHISFHDIGQGIPEEVKPKIFQPLFSTKAKGQGFGLPVVKRFVEAHNGTLRFESEPGKGTTFMIMLPS
jgi:PAS domain S-box-containing protein